MIKQIRLIPFLISLSLLLCSNLAYGQGTVSGKVLKRGGDPVIGATVVIKSLQIGALTGEDGSFTLRDVPAGTHVVLASFVGFNPSQQTVEVPSSGTVSTSFELMEKDVTLDEVVVVGYGSQKKRNVVGSVVKIGAEQLNENIGGSVETALQGKTPGIQIVQSSGVAGAGAVIRVRGIGSLSSGGDPLFVVDGIPITQDNFLNGETGGLNNNPLSSINPDDIESIEILKDASAAAIYGSRGSNGVILITTKRGKVGSGKPTFEFKARGGLSTPTNVIDLLNASEWLQVQQEAWENDGNVGRAPLPQNLTYEDIQGVDTDWLDQVLQTGVKQDYNLSMTQGSKKIRTYVGLSYTDAESYQIGNSYQRLTGRVNVDFNLLPNLEVGVSSSIARGLNDRIEQAWSGGLGYAQSTALPIFPIKDENGDWFNLNGNPVAQREFKDWKTREIRSINNFKLNYQPIKGLNINATGSYDYMDLGDYFLEDSVWTGNETIAKGFKSKVNNWSAFLTGQYQLDLGENHDMSILGGLEYQGSVYDKVNEEYSNIFVHLYDDPSFNNNVDTLKYELNEEDRWFFASAFFRLNYAYKDKWLFQGSFRRDGSSKYGKNQRFGNFPSIGLGYILSEESWFQNDIVSFLKLKTSWGITGNSDIRWQEQFPIFYPNNIGGIDNSQGYNGRPIRYQSKLENPDLKWEVSETWDAGFELGLFNDRITAEFSYYYKLTSDAIINIAIQSSSGIDDLIFAENVGKIENQGIEVSLTSQNLVGNFRWETQFNIAANDNLVLEVGTATPDALDGGFGDVRAVPGEPVNTNFIVRFSHIDDATGAPVYLTRSGEETFNYSVVENRVAAGNGMPDFTGGLTNTFKYKGFDLSALLVFSKGGLIYDDAAKRHMGVVTSDWNMRADIFDRWQQPGDEAMYPRLTQDMQNWGGNSNFWQNNHTLWLEDASYMRLRTVTFGYTKNNLKNGPFKSFRVFFTGTNLMTWTNYSGWDPEIARDRTNPQQRNIGGTNITYLTPPQEKSYNLGVNLSF